jgi:hypothetical protein
VVVAAEGEYQFKLVISNGCEEQSRRFIAMSGCNMLKRGVEFVGIIIGLAALSIA